MLELIVKREKLHSATAIKNHFKYNIQLESNCASHCATYALSDQKDKNFKSTCEHGEHDEVCSHCESIPELLMSLLGAVKFVRENFQLTELQSNELYYAVDQAQHSISHYKNHLIHSYVQNTYWDEMVDKESLDTVFITQDWSMKFLPIQFRENQTKLEISKFFQNCFHPIAPLLVKQY